MTNIKNDSFRKKRSIQQTDTSHVLNTNQYLNN